MLYEYEEVDFPAFGEYVRSLPFAKTSIAKKLGFTVQQIEGWIDRGRAPRCVYRRMIQDFGRGNVKGDPKVKEVRKPYRVPAIAYAHWLKVSIKLKDETPVAVIEPPKVPEPTPRPESVSWATFENTMMLLLHQSTRQLSEIGALESELTRVNQQNELLANHIKLLTGEKSFDITSKALDRVQPIHVDKNSEVHKESMRLLDSLKSVNGNGTVLSDLERRIRPLAAGPLS